MDEDRAKRLGELLHQRRTELGLSLRELEARTGIENSTIVRFEKGAYAAPSPEKLSKLAAALQLPLADVFAAAEYIVPAELPSLNLYLRTKFRTASDPAIEELNRELQRIAIKYGFDPNGPAPGEDEASDPVTPKSKQKGGRHASSS